MDFEEEKKKMLERKSFKFRKYPFFISFFKIKENANIEEATKIDNKIFLGRTFKKFGFKLGNIVSSFWFIAFLFYFQSYFLKQNLQKSDSKFISD